ncbi:hypothetical protein BWI17_17465 [Betaproteobacteria bacterium GR16-43]|nr:hypothetical protein BWI17_17465 [Betaproteobacteria bacterium GR16-43]
MAQPVELPYDESTRCAERHAWLDSVRPLGWAVFLDSGDPARTTGRYDVIAAAPRRTLVVEPGQDAFAATRALLAEAGPASAAGSWPIAGGAIGYFGYELGRRFAKLPAIKAGTTPLLPEAAIGLYAWTIVIDHQERRAAITSLDAFSDADAAALRQRLLAPPPAREPFRVLGEVASTLDREAYLPRAARVIEFIHAGDCYQANLTREFRVPCSGDPWDLYRQLHDTNPAPMGAFLEYPFGAVLSSSPERFVTVEGREVLTRPIKGTRRRRADPAQDAAARAELLASTKDRAENVMIVDLLRNDLGRVCEPGSVATPEICRLETFATVHHLVSTVTGRLAAGNDALHLLEACFPGGSITGAPKKRAMEIIDALEPHRREVYCGAIGYVSATGRMDMNIPIRTTVCAKGEIRFYAGGGIVADSSPESEYEETEVKIAAIRAALQRFAVPAPPDPEKSELRRIFIAKRDAHFANGSAAFSASITQRLRELPAYRDAKTVLATFSIGKEWDTRPFAEAVLADGKTLVLPRVVKKPRMLELYAVRDLSADLVPGVWGIEEPDPARCERRDIRDVDFALVPALAVDCEGIRLGYGAGYFDRLLAGSAPGTLRVVALPDAFFIDKLPREPHDIAVDAVMTETHFHRIAEEQ